MSKVEKDIKKFYKKPVPNDITYEEMERVAKSFGCIVDKKGGKHPLRVVHKKSGRIIPIPVHGKTVKEAYIKQLKDLFDMIKEEHK
ncbi:type II toxin-antitoxin system HicA family toxin [Zhenpiania hominis]|uniref:type II toxin-antitoxin system HicA family toxin n=1 Tax=Zhenpiania hominis TaxID=2763644 RepID=UPI0039F57CFF